MRFGSANRWSDAAVTAASSSRSVLFGVMMPGTSVLEAAEFRPALGWVFPQGFSEMRADARDRRSDEPSRWQDWLKLDDLCNDQEQSGPVKAR